VLKLLTQVNLSRPNFRNSLKCPSKQDVCSDSYESSRGEFSSSQLNQIIQEEGVMKIEQLRAQAVQEFLSRWFLFAGLPVSDTYKRTMWSTSDKLASAHASYHLTMRKGLPENGANDQLIVSGHEWMLRQWFGRPLSREVIETAIEWYQHHSTVNSFPVALFESLFPKDGSDEIYLPIDVWGFPGGQTFLKGVPMLSFSGPGGLVSSLEPHMCRYFAPVIHATKSRLMYEAAGYDHAEFGYRSDTDEPMTVAKLLSIFVGGGGKPILTSADNVEFMFPKLFLAIGTLGHEYMCSLQDFDRGLDDAEREAMELFVSHHDRASLLCDLVDAETVGLENAIAVMKAHPDKPGIGIRVDSGDIKGQVVMYAKRMIKEGLGNRLIVFEDEVNPDMVREVRHYSAKEVAEGGIPFPGAGGYYNRGLHRDTLSAAFKRSKTEGRPNVKFSNSPGKESVPGDVRVYEQGSKLVVADVTEVIDGKPLYVQLVKEGRIVNPEDMDFVVQAQRGNDTWNKYQGVTFSPLVSEWREKFQRMRVEAQERARSLG
jgi:nicotinate phosphoribosyltransferase